jgi:hypothetical protein
MAKGAEESGVVESLVPAPLLARMNDSSIRAARGPLGYYTLPARDNAHDFPVPQRRQSHSTSVLPDSTRAFVLGPILHWPSHHSRQYGSKGCIELLTSGSALWHVCSLRLGGTPFLKDNICGESLKGYFTILEAFAQRRTLTRLSLSANPDRLLRPLSEGKNQGCNYHAELNGRHLRVVRVRVFLSRRAGFLDSSIPPLDSPDIRDCAVESESSDDDTFSGLPKHKLFVKHLQLGSRRLEYFSLSSLIEDADLDISLLASFTCSVRSAEEARRVVTVTSSSPIQHFQFACLERDRFQRKSWVLGKYLLALISAIHIQGFMNPIPAN